jgi:hypothetical protein
MEKTVSYKFLRVKEKTWLGLYKLKTAYRQTIDDVIVFLLNEFKNKKEK